ncbi:type 1 glutamine amidotransferase domain-containing protein [Enterovibrio paralichthyis]|uniref:type 1 glutamine amidotransferase domain-containing protein n=1 Tax=Enterovibrio paralichthyis TaxID=2853805 RepID=UPI001C47AAE4|nr:type 1 glutamine amidotransferase domain-containing protein [Enterovibrio paralichthyis]MBV7299715.1 type 1 glutamine amidotransferase domain-containing protein [Enterovibrio paralichthyis]
MKKILIIVTNHATLGTTDQANGTYAPELTHALDAFLQAGFAYDVASINGGEVPFYGENIEDDEVNTRIFNNDEFQSRVKNTIPVSQLNVDDYDAVFYPGGFGLLSDLALHAPTASLTAKLYENGGIVGAVCHGPAALLPITLSNGKPLIEDKTVTSFTREEEVDFGTIQDIPFLLEEALTRKAAKFSKIQPWGVHVIVDGKLVTGQNPASAHGVGEAMVELLK